MKLPLNFLRDFGWLLNRRKYFPMNMPMEFMFDRIRVKCASENMDKVFHKEEGLRMIERLKRFNKQFESEVVYEPMFTADPKGEDARSAYFKIKNNECSVRTKHPNILTAVMKTNAAAKMWMSILANQLADNQLHQSDFESLCKKMDAPPWFSSGTAILAYNMKVMSHNKINSKVN